METYTVAEKVLKDSGHFRMTEYTGICGERSYTVNGYYMTTFQRSNYKYEQLVPHYYGRYYIVALLQYLFCINIKNTKWFKTISRYFNLVTSVFIGWKRRRELDKLNSELLCDICKPENCGEVKITPWESFKMYRKSIFNPKGEKSVFTKILPDFDTYSDYIKAQYLRMDPDQYRQHKYQQKQKNAN